MMKNYESKIFLILLKAIKINHYVLRNFKSSNKMLNVHFELFYHNILCYITILITKSFLYSNQW